MLLVVATFLWQEGSKKHWCQTFMFWRQSIEMLYLAYVLTSINISVPLDGDICRLHMSRVASFLRQCAQGITLQEQ